MFTRIRYGELSWDVSQGYKFEDSLQYQHIWVRKYPNVKHGRLIMASNGIPYTYEELGIHPIA